MSTIATAWVPQYAAVRFTITNPLAGQTVKRVTPGNTLQPIRGYGDDSWWSGTSTNYGYDYEMPMGVTVRYALVDKAALTLPAGPRNLVTAGAYGTFEGGVITGWAGIGAAPPTIAADATTKHSGSHSMKVTWATVGSYESGVQTTAGPTVVGQQYTVEAWLYIPTGSPPASLVIADGAFAGNIVTVKDQWALSTVTFTANATTTFVAVDNRADATAGQICYVDDVKLYDPTYAAPPTASIFTMTPGSSNGEAWLRDILMPVLSQPVSVLSTGDERRVARQAVYDIAGKPNPVVVWDSRTGREGTVTLGVQNTPVAGVWDTNTPRDRMDLLLSSGRPLLLSMCAQLGFLPCYMAVADATYTRIGTGATWALQLDYVEVDNPSAIGVYPAPEVTYALAQQIPPNAIYNDWTTVDYYAIATRTMP